MYTKKRLRGYLSEYGIRFTEAESLGSIASMKQVNRVITNLAITLRLYFNKLAYTVSD